MSDAKLFSKLIPELTEIVSQKMETNITLMSEGKQRQFYEDEIDFILGYVTALSDILTQHSGGESGGSIVQSVILRTLQGLFGEKQGMQFFNLTASYMDKAEMPEEFNSGLSAGISDSNEWLNGNQKYGVGKNFISRFIS